MIRKNNTNFAVFLLFGLQVWLAVVHCSPCPGFHMALWIRWKVYFDVARLQGWT